MTVTDAAPCPAWCSGDHGEPLEHDIPGGPIHESDTVLVGGKVPVGLCAVTLEDGQLVETLDIGNVEVPIGHAHQLATLILTLVEVHEGRLGIDSVPRA